MYKMGETKAALVFKVKRQPPELIPPVAPTPHEFKELSDIDDQETLRFQAPYIFFYSGGSAVVGRDPVRVIKDAVAKALVPYYPLAGRLKEMEGRKLVVECTGDGILFIEADADVTIHDFGVEDALYPPFPCLEELLYDVPSSSALLHSPLLLFQVTRLKCGGFVLASRINHTMADGSGFLQFMKAVQELVGGARSLSVWPVWDRHLLCARNPPRVTSVIPAYDEVPDTRSPSDNMVHKSFIFGPKEMVTLRSMVPPNLKGSTRLETLTACIWRCYTMAIQPDPEELVRIMTVVNARSKFNPPLPTGYYGNAVVFRVATSTAHELIRNPFGYSLELVRKTKHNDITDEYMRSLVDLMVIKDRPHISAVRTLVITDLTKAGLSQMDFGWGPPVFSGLAKGGVGAIPGLMTGYLPYNSKIEKGIVVPICLARPAMDRFEKKLKEMLSDHAHGFWNSIARL